MHKYFFLQKQYLRDAQDIGLAAAGASGRRQAGAQRASEFEMSRMQPNSTVLLKEKILAHQIFLTISKITSKCLKSFWKCCRTATGGTKAVSRCGLPPAAPILASILLKQCAKDSLGCSMHGNYYALAGNDGHTMSHQGWS